MLNDYDALSLLTTDEVLRPILNRIGLRLRIGEPAEVLKVALAVLSQAGDERVARGARLLLEYPNGDCQEMVFWNTARLKLATRHGNLVGDEPAGA